MGHAFSGTIAPFARILLLSRRDVIIVDMLHKVIHVAQVAGVATLPFAHGDLLIARAKVVF